MSILLRIAASAIVLVLCGFLNIASNVVSGQIAGNIAVEQLTESNIAPLKTAMAAHYLNGSGILLDGLALLIVLLIWVGPVIRLLGVTFFIAGFALIAAGSRPAEAYYSKYDYGEYIEILPNQSAFMIAETGDTKTNQQKFGSESFLTESKVAAKRVQIPHTKLLNSGTLSDFFVPAARLVIVDRSPVSREWTTSANRGTSANDQGFRFETADSIGLSTSIVISAFVKEEDAAKFLYWFGTKTDPHMNDSDEARFASVLYGKSLAEVVDSNVHRTVQTVLASEFGKRTTDQALHDKAEIIAAVEKAVKDQFGPMGITVTTLGLADQLNFENPQIQHAIDDTYMANKRAQSAQAQLATLPVQQKILDMEIQRIDAATRSKLADKWNGSAAGILPSWVIFPSDLIGAVKGWLSGTPAASGAPAQSVPMAATK
jgi:hypothetical protein